MFYPSLMLTLYIKALAGTNVRIGLSTVSENRGSILPFSRGFNAIGAPFQCHSFARKSNNVIVTI